MIKLSATSLGGFCGLNRKKNPILCCQDYIGRVQKNVFWLNSCKRQLRSQIVEDRLRSVDADFFKEYINAEVITPQMIQKSKHLVKLTSREENVSQRPFQFYNRQRGKNLESTILKK